MCLHCFEVPDVNKTWQRHQQRLFCLSVKVAPTVIVYDKNRFYRISQWIMWWEVNSLWFIILRVGGRWPFVRSWWEKSLPCLLLKKKKSVKKKHASCIVIAFIHICTLKSELWIKMVCSGNNCRVTIATASRMSDSSRHATLAALFQGFCWIIAIYYCEKWNHNESSLGRLREKVMLENVN